MATPRTHLPGNKLGTGYCGTRTRDITPNANCPNCAAALQADQQAQQLRKETNR